MAISNSAGFSLMYMLVNKNRNDIFMVKSRFSEIYVANEKNINWVLLPPAYEQ